MNSSWRQHFGRDAADLVAVATTLGGFDLQTVLLRCFKRSRRSERVAVPTVEAVLQEMADEDRWLPVLRELDGVTFYLAFDAKGEPFYTDVEPK